MIEIENPVWIAPSPFTEDIESIKKSAESGPGGIVLKTVSFKKSSPCNRKCDFCEKNKGIGTKKGRLSFRDKSTLYTLSPNSRFCELISREEAKSLLMYLKKRYPAVTRIVSMAGRNFRENIEMAQEMERNYAQIIELNPRAIGWFWSNLESKQIIEIVKGIKQKISLPVIVKIPDYLLEEDFFRKLANYCDGLTITNTIYIDLPKKFENKVPLTIKKRKCVMAGKPLWSYLKNYVPIAKKHFKFVSASGGIDSVKKAKEIMSLGADAIQLYSGIEIHGYGLVKNISESLSA
jgi:dihydroorotate dehydrogenase